MYEMNLYTILLKRQGHTIVSEGLLPPHVHKDKTPKLAENRDKLLMRSSDNIFLACFTNCRQRASSFTL